MGDASERTISITANVPESLYEILVDLANKRGVSANTVLQQAIGTEKYLADKEQQGAKVLIEEPDKTIKRVVKIREHLP